MKAYSADYPKPLLFYPQERWVSSRTDLEEVSGITLVVYCKEPAFIGMFASPRGLTAKAVQRIERGVVIGK